MSAICLVRPLFFVFLLPAFGQCILLHPRFGGNRIARALRFVLGLATVALALTVPLRPELHFQPREKLGCLNFALGVVVCYAVFKAVEWALVQDTTAYTWVGDVGATAPAESEIQARVHSSVSAARADGPVTILRKSVHLCCSMRGSGYAFGLYRYKSRQFRALMAEWPPRRPVLYYARTLAWSHIFMVGILWWLLKPRETRMRLITEWIVGQPTATVAGVVPGQWVLDLSAASPASKVDRYVNGFLTGSVVYTSLTYLYTVATVLMHGLHIILQQPFHLFEYPPLFLLPPYECTSVSAFWRDGWHDFFAVSFRFLGYDSAMRLGVPAALSQIIAVVNVFLLSALLHEFGIAVASRHLSRIPPFDIPLVQHRSFLFFMSQGVAIIIESILYRVFKLKMQGLVGFLWITVATYALSHWAYDAWNYYGILNMDSSDTWQAVDYIVPLAFLVPK